MREESDLLPPPDSGDPNSSGMTVLWLLAAFAPSFVAIPLINNLASFGGAWLFVLTGGCSLFAAFGVLRRMKAPVLRIVLGLLLAGLFFILNVFIVILIGCSGMGRIAP